MAIRLIHYSDLLCVWAYVGEARIEEIRSQFADRVEIEQRFCSVFGDCSDKIGSGWESRGGYEGFAAHVQEVAAGSDDITVHPDLWQSTRPASSEGAHLFVKASQLLEERGELEPGTCWKLCSSLRRAFFEHAQDIARREVQCEVASSLGLSLSAIDAEICSGAAFAALARDARGRDEWGVRGSPTLILNEGRQKLYGNVGYRVIEANIQELLREPASGQASWC